LGLHAESTPIKALLPRDLHIGLTDFEEVNEKEEIEYEVVGARFQQGDESIVVLGKLLKIVQPAQETVETVVDDIPMLAAPVGKEDTVVKKVTVELSAAKGPEAPRKRKVRLNPEAKTNEALPEGKA
jgi:hypothetical protein